MAIRRGKTEVIKVLIELVAEIPLEISTGLTEQELFLAKWKAKHFGAVNSETAASDIFSPVIEEIQVTGCYETDTGVLDAEMRRAVEEICKNSRKS